MEKMANGREIDRDSVGLTYHDAARHLNRHVQIQLFLAK